MLAADGERKGSLGPATGEVRASPGWSPGGESVKGAGNLSFIEAGELAEVAN